MPEPDLIELFVARFSEIGAHYLVTGSVAATLYGEPRATHDIDLVVELSVANHDTLPKIFPIDEFYLAAAGGDPTGEPAGEPRPLQHHSSRLRVEGGHLPDQEPTSSTRGRSETPVATP